MKKAILFVLYAAAVFATDFRIVTPYYGFVTNELAVERMGDLKDTAPLGGFFFQWVNPDLYQWNVFVCQSQNINQSDILGAHFIFDYYPGKCPRGGKLVVGAGFDYIQIKTDGEFSPAMSGFKMTNRISAPHLRFGRYIDFGNEMKQISLLPWGGVEMELIRGDVRFNVMAPGMPFPIPVNEEIRDDYTYALIGFNSKMTLYHFFELSAKYYRKFSLDDHQDLDVFSGMVNLYLNRHWGLSYRFKYMEVSVATNTYHIGGIAYVF